MFDTIIFVGVIFGSVAGIFFPFYYHYLTKGDWKSSGMGQNIMAFGVTFALFYVSGYIRILGFNNEILEGATRAILTFMTGGILWWRILLFRKIHNDAEKELLRLTRGSDANDIQIEQDRIEVNRVEEQFARDEDEALIENQRLDDSK